MLKDSKTDMGFLTIFSKTYPSLLTFNQGIFLKSTRPSLPLKKAPPLFSVFFNGLYPPPSVPPFPGDRNLRGKEETAPPRRS